jgi:hypothetical protein
MNDFRLPSVCPKIVSVAIIALKIEWDLLNPLGVFPFCAIIMH